MTEYGQFCPVAKAMELLDERWTMLVVRELLAGSTRFNDLRRGNPKMSPALLSKRLRTLERAGVVLRTVEGGHSSYTLTPCGAELATVVEALGAWGVRWVAELDDADLDPHLLMWDMHRTMPIGAWPRERTVVAFEFEQSARPRSWWLCVSDGEADVCERDPGFDVTATVDTGLRTLVEIWRGDRSWEQAIGAGMVTIAGPTWAAREVPRWLGQMTLAATTRPG
ncbi:Transcriptional regulator, HxlR family [Rhodococcus sp. RD6.2]|jgi:DNA-binding HxlR family transcriptional regulator|uniref:winged helix-turn-helix transcriptional regulator n=1 Tax=Rhodococcus sp. RD6.2 TaxID=260936 RepID=UPI00063B5822|nr:helix-turn-helix domain-containing protein [Rhodococcus sp. RD6.2]CRK52293.1 Transcriptional regulator, HxlR family [Rhodococcus sp. RD6.2]